MGVTPTHANRLLNRKEIKFFNISTVFKAQKAIYSIIIADSQESIYNYIYIMHNNVAFHLMGPGPIVGMLTSILLS